MSIFEFLTALYAIVAGLGVSLLVRSVGQIIEARDRVRLYWVHSGWLALMFVAHVISWFALWRFLPHDSWTVLEALLLLTVPILLYLVSHLAVPELEDGRQYDLREYYYRHARWMQGLLLASLIATAAAQHLVEGAAVPRSTVMVRGLIAAILLPGVLTADPRVHRAQVPVLAVVLLFALSYLARPIG